jgi:hypothetical protein
MPGSETYSGLLEFFEEDLYATVQLLDTGDGWVSEWWVSRNVAGTYELQLLGCLRVPVYGKDKEEAYRRIQFIYEDVLNSMSSWSGGVGFVGSGGDVISARKHCKSHLQKWGEEILNANRTEHTAALYSFAVEFGVNNPAALIAEVEVLPSVRTVHDRIAYARRIGILDSYGKGRIKGHGYEDTNRDQQQELWEQDDYDLEDNEQKRERRNSIIERILRHSGDI